MVVMVKVLLVLVLVLVLLVRTAIQTGPLARSSKVFFFSFPCFLFPVSPVNSLKTRRNPVLCPVLFFLFGLFFFDCSFPDFPCDCCRSRIPVNAKSYLSLQGQDCFCLSDSVVRVCLFVCVHPVFCSLSLFSPESASRPSPFVTSCV